MVKKYPHCRQNRVRVSPKYHVDFCVVVIGESLVTTISAHAPSDRKKCSIAKEPNSAQNRFSKPSNAIANDYTVLHCANPTRNLLPIALLATTVLRHAARKVILRRHVERSVDKMFRLSSYTTLRRIDRIQIVDEATRRGLWNRCENSRISLLATTSSCRTLRQ